MDMDEIDGMEEMDQMGMGKLQLHNIFLTLNYSHRIRHGNGWRVLGSTYGRLNDGR
jgi:hypothetical protein